MQRKLTACLAVTALIAGGVVASTAVAGAEPGITGASPTLGKPGQQPVVAPSAVSGDYVVLVKDGASIEQAKADVLKTGATVVAENAKIGYLFVKSADASFPAKASASAAVEGTARNRIIGDAPKPSVPTREDVEKLTAERAASKGQATAPAAAAPAGAARKGAVGTPTTPEPLSNLQWDMRQIGATANGSYAVQPGSKKVMVGIIDTGVDGTHPDIAPNFDKALSANFVVDNPLIDGTDCEHPSCVDPVDEDDNGHGTHVASTIGSPINGLGIAGVAPNVTLVNIRAGQDSGYFFLQPTLEALVYAGDIGVDVVNMSYYTDPWLYNCTNNPADSPAEQTEQRVIRVATQRALNYAINHGVLPVSAEGNEHTDLGNPTFDDTSPDFPPLPGVAKPRTVDNSCLNVPAESNGVVTVSSTGPSTRLAYYSNYGTEQTDVAAPGGDAYDSTNNALNVGSEVLAAYPESLAKLNGDLNPDGTPNTPFVVRDCKGAVCGYYQYLQGTSMAAPHAVGVAALIVSQYGKPDASGGLTLSPAKTTSRLYDSAVEHACPQPRTFTWDRLTKGGTVLVTSQATCDGSVRKNGFYGHGIVNAYAAATGAS